MGVYDLDSKDFMCKFSASPFLVAFAFSALVVFRQHNIYVYLQENTRNVKKKKTTNDNQGT